MFCKKIKQQGFGLVEILIGLAIVSSSILVLSSIANISLRSSSANTKNLQAGFLIEEGIESVRALRDADWTNISSLSVDTDYYLAFDGFFWQATSNNIYIDNIFERSFILEDVYRDANDDIAPTGTLDPDTKRVVVSVSWWDRNATTTKSVFTYITNLF